MNAKDKTKRTSRTEAAKGGRTFQACVLYFDDGTTATFTGPAIAQYGEELRIVKVVFSDPHRLDDDEYFEDKRCAMGRETLAPKESFCCDEKEK